MLPPPDVPDALAGRITHPPEQGYWSIELGVKKISLALMKGADVIDKGICEYSHELDEKEIEEALDKLSKAITQRVGLGKKILEGHPGIDIRLGFER